MMWMEGARIKGEFVVSCEMWGLTDLFVTASTRSSAVFRQLDIWEAVDVAGIPRVSSSRETRDAGACIDVLLFGT